MTQDLLTLRAQLRDVGAGPGWTHAAVVVNRCLEAANAIELLIGERDTALQRAEQAQDALQGLSRDYGVHTGKQFVFCPWCGRRLETEGGGDQ